MALVLHNDTIRYCWQLKRGSLGWLGLAVEGSIKPLVYAFSKRGYVFDAFEVFLTVHYPMEDTHRKTLELRIRFVPGT